MPKKIKSLGSTNKVVTTHNTNFSIGTDGLDDYGETKDTGFWVGIDNPECGYTIYVHRNIGGPTIHVAHSDEQCIFFLKSFGSTGSTINDVLNWASNRTDIWVDGLGCISPTPTSTPTPTPTPTPTSTTVPPTSTPTPTSTTVPPTSTPTPTATAPPPVASDPTLEIWYDFSDNTTITLGTGTDITAVSDKSTGTVKPANSTGGKRPKQVTSYQNSLNVSYFDGANDLFTINPITNFQSLTGNTMIIVGKFNNASATNTMTQLGTNSAQRNASWLSITGGKYKLGMGQGLATTTSATDTNFHIFTCVFDGTQTGNSNRLKFRIDGTDKSLTFTQSVSATTSSDGTVFYIGETADATEDLDGYIGEILLYTKTLNSTEITNTETYLSNKWNIQLTQGPVINNLVLHYDPSNTSSYVGTGTTINDLSGNGLNGTMSNISFTSPYFTYNGTNSQISISDNALLEPGSGDWTMEVWVNQNATGNDVVLGKFDPGGLAQDVSYSIRTTSSTYYAQLGSGSGSGATLYQNSTNHVGTLNTWYQIVYVFTNVAANTFETFVNGSSIGSVNHSLASILNTSANLYIGSYNNGEYAQWFDGKIGITRLYNKALTSTEVLQNFNSDKSKYGL